MEAESYSLATAAVLVYFVLALEYLAGRRRLAWVGLALLTGVALHKALLCLAPSFLYLAFARRDQGRPAPVREVLQGAGIALLILVLVIMTSGQPGTHPLASMIVPLTPNAAAQYTLLSWQHVVDFLNEQTLVSPLGRIVAGLLAAGFLRDRALRRSRRPRFLFLAAGFALGFAFLLRPGLGGSRDWDLWSMASLPCAVGVACWMGSAAGRAAASNRAGSAHAAYVVVVVGAFHVLPWVAVNASSELSLDHYSRMLQDNPLWPDKRIAVSRNDLAFFYWDKQDFPRAAELFAGAVAKDPATAEYWKMLGLTHIALGKLGEAETALARAADLEQCSGSASADRGE